MIFLLAFFFVGAPLSFLVAYRVKQRLDLREGREAGGDTKRKAKKGRKDPAESNRLPYRYADDRILVFKDSVWAGVKVRPVTDEQLSEEELLEQVFAATGAIQDLPTSDDETPYMVRLTHRPISFREWAEQLILRSWNPTMMYKVLVRRIAGILEHQETTKPEVYLLVKIAKVARETGSRDIARRLDHKISGVYPETEVTRDSITTWHELAENLYSRLAGLPHTRMTRDDMLWLIRKPLHGHLTPSQVDYLPTSRPWGGGEFQLAASLDGINGVDHLELRQVVEAPDTEGNRGTSYTAFLVAASWPAREHFRLERSWLRYVARMPGQVELCMRGTHLAPAALTKEAKKQRDDLRDELKNAEKSGQVPDNIEVMLEQKDRMDKLLTQQHRQPVPGLNTQIILQLSAPTIEQLDSLVRDVRQALKIDLDRDFVRISRHQWRLLEGMLPGDGPESDWLPAPHQRLQEAEVFGFGMPATGSSVGDNPVPGHDGSLEGFTGDYIGFTDDGVPAHYSTTVGPLRNSGGGVTSVGASGGGKSTLALMKFFYESEAGARCLVIDPKVDFAKFCLYVAFGPQVNEAGFDDELSRGVLGDVGKGSKFTPVNQEFWDETEIVDVTHAHDGALEVFALARDVSSGFLDCENVFQMFCDKSEFEALKLPLTRAIAAVRQRYENDLGQTKTASQRQKVTKPSMWEISEHVIGQFTEIKGRQDVSFEERRAAEHAAGIVETLRLAPYARLVFSEEPRPLRASPRRRTIFTIRGMELPSARINPDNWTRSNRLATTILFLITKMGSEMLEVDQEPNPVTGRLGLRPKLLFVDEAYALTSQPQGQQLLQKALAQGRSYLLVTWLIDQQARRLAALEEEGSDEATGNQVHTVFAYRQKTMGEARSMLPLLGREGNDDTARTLLPSTLRGGRMETGVAMMRDVDGRVAVVNIDVVFRELLAAAETNPDKRPLRQGVSISADAEEWSILGTSELQEAAHSADDDSETASAGAEDGDLDQSPEDLDEAPEDQDEPEPAAGAVRDEQGAVA